MVLMLIVHLSALACLFYGTLSRALSFLGQCMTATMEDTDRVDDSQIMMTLMVNVDGGDELGVIFEHAVDGGSDDDDGHDRGTGKVRLAALAQSLLASLLD